MFGDLNRSLERERSFEINLLRDDGQDSLDVDRFLLTSGLLLSLERVDDRSAERPLESREEL